MAYTSKVTAPVVEVEPEVPDVEPEVEAEPEVPVAPVVVTRAEALIAEAEVPEPEEQEDYEAYLAAETARREAWVHG